MQKKETIKAEKLTNILTFVRMSAIILKNSYILNGFLNENEKFALPSNLMYQRKLDQVIALEAFHLIYSFLPMFLHKFEFK